MKSNYDFGSVNEAYNSWVSSLGELRGGAYTWNIAKLVFLFILIFKMATLSVIPPICSILFTFNSYIYVEWILGEDDNAPISHCRWYQFRLLISL